MEQRARSALIFVPPLVVVLVLGEPWLGAVILLAVGLGSLEALRLLRAAGYPVLVGLGMAIALAMVVDAAVPVDLAGSAALLVAVAVMLAAVGAFTRRDPGDGLASWLGTVFGGVYVGLLSFVVRVGQAAPDLPPGAPLAAILDGGRAWVLILVLSVWAYDTGAYLIGRSFGERFGEATGLTRFLVHISPSKTYAGLFGGLAATTIVLGLGLWAAGAPVWQALIVGPAVGLAAQAGDLAESLLKRAAGAKDSGQLIPGHGGILDRVDSLLFAAPVLTLYLLTFGR
ncbi:MAG: phosphatidate cytidylyltransferase [Chloroflexota bacterium]|nr:phosphatidate cytidylyltransferase [Chloroflexota bacterium]